jgi:4-hydroxy-tetrahydrodipicolinate reductase
MSLNNDYVPSIEEIHHTQKKDAPSGTAITLAEDLMKKITAKTGWVNETSNDPSLLSIISKREDDVPGTHVVKYESANDVIEIIHTSKNRKGFAQGVLLAAKFMMGKKGIFSMRDVLDL